MAKTSVLIGVDSLCTLAPRRRRGIALVVRLDAVGDFFLWMQYGAREIARFARTADRKVVLIANSAWGDYARSTGLWDGVLEVDPARLFKDARYRMTTLLRIRRLGAALMIQPRAARVFLLEDSIARTCGAETRIGSAGTLSNMRRWQRRAGNACYSRVIQVDEGNSVHETLRNRQFVSALVGRAPERWQPPRPRCSPPTGGVVVALGAGDAGRVWPVEKLATVIRHLVEKYPHLPIRLYGLAAETEASAQLQALGDGRVESMVGRTTLDEFVAAVAAARLIVCNESSAYHIAMAYGTPVLCFLGGGHYGQFAPYPPTETGCSKAAVLSHPMDCFGCNWKCRYERAGGTAYPCVASISADCALSAVDRLLAPERVTA